MNKAIIFGASRLGKIAYESLKDKYRIDYFCDNDCKKVGKKIFDIEVMNPDRLRNLKNEYEIIVASSYNVEISKQLFELEIKNFKLFFKIKNSYDMSETDSCFLENIDDFLYIINSDEDNNFIESNSNNSVRNFYNEFVNEHIKDVFNSINFRHVYLKNRLKQVLFGKKNVLDIGCGIGIIASFIKGFGTENVYGIDISDNSIMFAKKTFPNINFLAGDIAEMKLDIKLDGITLCDVLEHIPKEKYYELFNALEKKLNDDGVIYISIPNYKYRKYLDDEFPQTAQIIDNSITFNEIEYYCEQNGLEIKFYNTYGIIFKNEYNEFIITKKCSYEDDWEKIKDICLK